MKLIIQLFLFIFLLLFIGLISPKDTFANSFTLSGNVTTESGSAIGGTSVTVTEINSGNSFGTVTTDSSTGYYQVTSIPAGSYKVQVVPPTSSGLQSTFRNIDISDNTTANFLLVPGQPLITVSGQITAGGIAVSGMKVNNATTNSNGFYSFTQAPGIVELFITNNPNNSSLKVNFNVNFKVLNSNAVADTMLNVQIPVNTLTVSVKDSSNNVIGSPDVVIYQQGGGSSSNVVPITVSTNFGDINTSISAGGSPFIAKKADANGVLVTPIIRGGPYQVEVYAPGDSYLPSISLLTVSSDTSYPVTLQNKPLITVKGHITAGGNPVSGIKVNNVLTNSSGFYSFTQQPGQVELFMVNSSSSSSLPINFNANFKIPNLNATVETTIDVQIPLNTLTVNVKDNINNNIANADVVVFPPGGNTSNPVPVSLATNLGVINTNIFGAGGGNSFFSGKTNQNGVFVKQIIRGGPYQIEVYGPGSNYLPSISSLTVSSDLTYPVTIQDQSLITISGHVTAGGIPVTGIKVGNVTTDNNGFYSYKQAPGGVTLNLHNISTSSSLPIDFHMDFQIPNLNATTNQTVNVQIPINTLSVHVQDENNSGIEDAGVVIYPPGGGSNSNVVPVTISTNFGDLNTSIYGAGSAFVSGATDGSGNYVSPIIRGGPYQIELYGGNNYLPSIAPLAVSSDINQIYSLQFSHSVPSTTISLSPDPNNEEQYSNPTTVTLNATAANGFTIANTYYSVDGGSQQTYSSPFTVSGEGEHTITYYSVDNSSISESLKSKTFTIHVNEKPVISSISNGNINEGDSYSFNSSFSDSDSNSWTATVDYGDGSGEQNLTLSGTNFSLNHIYNNPGTYTVTVKVTDNQGATGTKTATVFVNNIPEINPLSNQNINLGENFSFNGSFTDSDSTAWTALVDYGEGAGTQPLTLNGKSFTLDHLYQTAGTYTVHVKVTDNEGIFANAQLSVFVNAAPVIAAINDANINKGDVYSASGSFSDGGSTSWTATVNYGDSSGTSNLVLNGTNFSLNHTYANSGTFTVTVKVKDNQNFESTEIATITVNAYPTISPLSGADINLQDEYLEIGSFTDSDSTAWFVSADYGDGSPIQPVSLNGTSFTLNYTYQESGQYTVIVYITDNQGATSFAQATVSVNAAPVLNPFAGATISEGGTYSTSGSFSDPDSTSWTASIDYGDGSEVQNVSLSSTNFSLSHLYQDNGNYTVLVVVNDNKGAVDTESTTVVVNNVSPIIGAISTSPAPPVQVNTSVNASVTFNDPGVLDTHTASWNWGDGNTTAGTVSSGSVSDNYVYTTAGVYTVTLTLTDKDNGITTQEYQYISVYNPTPQGLFTGNRKFNAAVGSFPQNQELSGVVNFGVVSRYQNDVPTGQVSMDFNAANFEFEATSLTLLVTANGQATLRGTGTVNNLGNYNFLVTGFDGAQDAIRFQIKDQSGVVIFDSQLNASDTALPAASVTGQVIIH